MSNPIPGDDATVIERAIRFIDSGSHSQIARDTMTNELRKLLKSAPVSADVAADVEFNAQRLRNVAHLVGLQGAIPDSDATLDGSRGAVLGMIADRLRREMKWDADRAAGAPAETVKAALDDFSIEETADQLCDIGTFLLNAAQEFWNACRQSGQYGAVRWLTGSSGELLIYTRGEYREQLIENIYKFADQPAHHFATPSPSAEVARDAARYHKLKKLSKPQLLIWRGAFGCSDQAIDELLDIMPSDAAMKLQAPAKEQ